MIQKILHRILVRRHFWRHASFSEIAELYASRLLRMLAMNIVASFMSIYLYQQGFSIAFIALFWAVFYFYKVLVALPLAALSAWLGPKHGILISNLLFIPAMIAFALIAEYGLWSLVLVVLFQGVSSALYSISYSTDFSKVKSIEHAGKEIAYMNIVEKVAAGLSPLIGGVLAFMFGPQVVLVVAAFLFTLAALPLLRTSEQEAPRQKLAFGGFPWHLVRPTSASQVAVGFDVFASGTGWSLFVSVFIIGIASTNEIYVINGILISVVLFAALAASYTYGRLIDKDKGRDLLRIAIYADALTHFLRPFISVPVGVAGLNIANEAATTGYTMAYTRGIFDNADLSGKRTTYLGIVEILSNLGAALAGVVLYLLTTLMGNFQALQVFFFITAAVVLLVATARFPLYRK